MSEGGDERKRTAEQCVGTDSVYSYYENLEGISVYLADKISEGIGEDRLIPLDGVGRYAYVDTEGCAVYLITIQRAELVAAGGGAS